MAVTLGMALTACGAGNESEGASDSGSGDPGSGDSGSSLSGTLNGAGASSQEAAMGAWRSAFQGDNPDVTVNYDPVGSGGGREQFLAGGVLFAGSDAAMDDEELATSEDTCQGGQAFEVPSYVSPIAVVYNLEGVDDLRLDTATLAGIFAGTITTWDDPAIVDLNPDADLPGDKITPVHRSDDSGTTDNFTDYLHQAAGDVWTWEPDGVWPLKSGEGANGTSGVVEAVTGGANTIGYADHSQTQDLSAVQVAVGDAFVAPSAEGAAKTLEVSPRAEGRPEGDIAIEVDRTTTEAGAYPVILVSYVIACPTYESAQDADLVKGFLGYVVSDAGQQASADAAGSAPLPSSLAEEAASSVDAIAAAS
jgi:phosphate transport system substrate-binding protein